MMLKRLLATGILLSAPLVAATADDDALVTFQMLSPETALEAAVAAMEDCRGKGFQVGVAVVDRLGNMQALVRDRFAGPHTPETARRKGWTAVSFRTDTMELADVSQAGRSQSGVRFVSEAMMIGGGVPIEAAGSIVGGIGVSGAPGGGEDDACARAGIEAIFDKIAF